MPTLPLTLAFLQTTPASLGELINTIYTAIQPATNAIALLGLTVYFIFMFASPFLPEQAQANRGFVVKVLLGVIALALMPQLIGWLSELGTA